MILEGSLKSARRDKYPSSVLLLVPFREAVAFVGEPLRYGCTNSWTGTKYQWHEINSARDERPHLQRSKAPCYVAATIAIDKTLSLCRGHSSTLRSCAQQRGLSTPRVETERAGSGCTGM